MKCKEVNSNLIAYIENEISLETRKLVDKHLSGCQVCQVALKNLSSVYQEIENEKAEFTHNPYLGVKIWSKLKEPEFRTAPAIPIRRVTIAYIAAAGVFLGITLGTFLSNYLFDNNQTNDTETWTQLAEEYFPSNLYEPFAELNENEQ